jgi:hypothetical protein
MVGAMSDRPAPKRRRCCGCRKYFKPSPSAAKTQTTCSKKCRNAQRAKDARRRYAADPQRFRRLGRVRQQKARARRRAEAGPGPPTPPVPIDLRDFVNRRLEQIAAADRLAHEQASARVRRVVKRVVERALSRAGLPDETPATAVG